MFLLVIVVIILIRRLVRIILGFRLVDLRALLTVVDHGAVVIVFGFLAIPIFILGRFGGIEPLAVRIMLLRSRSRRGKRRQTS